MTTSIQPGITAGLGGRHWSLRSGLGEGIRGDHGKGGSVAGTEAPGPDPAQNGPSNQSLWRSGTMIRQAISSEGAPTALGPYSQAIVAGGFVFCSGTVGVDPVTGAIPSGIEAQTEQAL